jgi:phosphate transport system protein
LAVSLAASVSAGRVEELDELVLEAFARVRAALTASAAAFLSGDRDDARRVVADDKVLDDLHERIQAMALAGLLRHDAEVRALVTVIRIAPELERSGDLATHIADLGAQGLSSWLAPRARDLITQMAAIGVEMWQRAADAYLERDLHAGDRLRAIDDEIDDLHVSLITELAAMPVSVPVAVQVGLVARYFERLGDHAVNVTQQLRHLRA